MTRPLFTSHTICKHLPYQGNNWYICITLCCQPHSGKWNHIRTRRARNRKVKLQKWLGPTVEKQLQNGIIKRQWNDESNIEWAFLPCLWWAPVSLQSSCCPERRNFCSECWTSLSWRSADWSVLEVHTCAHAQVDMHKHKAKETQTGTNKHKQNKTQKLQHATSRENKTLHRREDRRGYLMDREEEVRRKPKRCCMGNITVSQ